MNVSNCNGDFEFHSWEDLEKQIKGQSGMMGVTEKIYLVESGRQALMKDVVYADIKELVR